MQKFICIHGHFYQPPRENPWLESVEPQESAYPYHDWNERINAECYAPNAAARILDTHQRIVHIVNNYRRISFNFGPTLLSWMEEHASDVYAAILEADRESLEHFSGHGCAIAQAYNHVILPLAPASLKRRQVRWGILDFEHRFGRYPEGFWLPETAVDLDTLECLAAEGIRYTILAPHQAARIKRIQEDHWTEISRGGIDTSRPYRQSLPSGRTIDLFFYDGQTSQAVAFQGLLKNGEELARTLLGRFDHIKPEPQLVHIATDGETYGHHHQFGEMALAYALEVVETSGSARITNYGEYLELHPPTWQVEIRENTSWSCAHGVERWKGDCGCSTGSHPGWTQSWRAPLRASLDWLAAELHPEMNKHLKRLLRTPARALDDYIDIVLDRSQRSVQAFLAKYLKPGVDGSEVVRVLKLLEMERSIALAYTSCGWFFDDISGIESQQVLRYAGRTIQLARELFEKDLGQAFQDRLGLAPSNSDVYPTGREVFEGCVKPVDLLQVGANFALCSLFSPPEESARVHCYSVETDRHDVFDSGNARVALGIARVASSITRESEVLSFGVLSMGNHTLLGGVRRFRSEQAYDHLKTDVQTAVHQANFPEVIRLLDRHFDKAVYSLNSLFQEEQQKILKIILDSTVKEVEESLVSIYRTHTPLMHYLEHEGVRLPQVLAMTAEYVLNTQLHQLLGNGEFNPARFRQLLAEVVRRKVRLDREALNFHFQQAMEGLAQQALTRKSPVKKLSEIGEALEIARSERVEANLWKVQNLYYERLQLLLEDRRSVSRVWLEEFLALSSSLEVHVSDAHRDSLLSSFPR